MCGRGNMSSTVSVIIPVYNAEKYIDECLNSVLSQSYQQIEIVVINDGSSDGTKEILDIKVENGIIKILCEFNNNTCQVIEAPIDFHGEFEINHEKESFGPNIILNEKFNIVIPIKQINNNYPFVLREWK